MGEIERFEEEVRRNAAALAEDAHVQELSLRWIRETMPYRYTYNFSWLGRPIIQFPQDVLALQEIIWSTRPDLIVETGIAHGGSLILSASLLELLGEGGHVIGVDIDIRPHNRREIEGHPLARRITMIEGSSTDPAVVERVAKSAGAVTNVMVILDSNHSHEHVLRELELYSPLVQKGSYIVVFDTVIEDMPAGSFPDRPWGVGNNPKTAVHEFLSRNSRFQIDHEMQAKLQITVAPDGFLRCVS